MTTSEPVFVRRIVRRRRRDVGEPEAGGVLLVGGPSSLELDTERPLDTEQAEGLVLSHQLGDQCRYLGAWPPAGESPAAAALRLAGLGSLRVQQFATELHTAPDPYETEWDDPPVICGQCGHRCSASRLGHDSLGDDDRSDSDRVCPACGTWDCCELRDESVAEFEARHGSEQLVLQCAGDPLAPPAAWESVDYFRPDQEPEARERLRKLGGHQLSWRLVRIKTTLVEGP